MKLNQDAVQDQIPPQSGEEVRRLLPPLALSHVSALVQSTLIFIFTLSSQTSLPQPQGGSTNCENNRQRSQYMERLNSIYDHFWTEKPSSSWQTWTVSEQKLKGNAIRGRTSGLQQPLQLRQMTLPVSAAVPTIHHHPGSFYISMIFALTTLRALSLTEVFCFI